MVGAGYRVPRYRKSPGKVARAFGYGVAFAPSVRRRGWSSVEVLLELSPRFFFVGGGELA